MKGFLLITMAALCISCSDNGSTPTETENPDPAEGMWLKYWSGSQPIQLNLNVDYYAVHFTKPSEWVGVRVDSVEIISASGGGDISLSFWATSSLGNETVWPSDPPVQFPPRTVAVGRNVWNIAGQQWTTTASEFFVGLQQGDVITLASDGQAQPEVRSYRRYVGADWEKEMAFASNYCIGIYVTRTM